MRAVCLPRAHSIRIRSRLLYLFPCCLGSVRVVHFSISVVVGSSSIWRCRGTVV